MGSSPSKPEFDTFLADKQVRENQDIILSCEANTEDATASWEKDGYKMKVVDGKHTVKKIGKKHILEISKANECDEGKYTITLSNSAGSVSCSAIVRVELKEWRTVLWRQDKMLNVLKTFNICSEVQELRFLVYGPVGAGKSSTINTIRTLFEGRQFVNCLAASGSTTSHTLQYERFRFANEKGLFPFAFNDVMGAEKENGVLTEDIISALKGHMKEGYAFNPTVPLTESNKYFNHNPSLNDQMHCLVNIIPADKIPVMDNDFMKKFKQVRKAAGIMGIPQVVFMTRVDCACVLTKENLRNVYKSKKIKEYMQKCSNVLGVPVNCIFPVWNYHQETHIKEDINCLMLDALTQVVHWANDYVVKCSRKETSDEKPFCE